MKKAQKQELRSKTVDELVKEVRDLRAEVARLSLDMTQQKVENTNLIYQKKKNIARILTYLGQKEGATK